LAQAFPKPNRLDTIIEKGTELGVDEFWLFPGVLSYKKELFPQQMERTLAITIAAIKQSGRLFLPKIRLFPPIERWEKFTSLSFFGDLSEHAIPFHQAAMKIHKDRYPLIFITGPESGFSTNEVATLHQLGSIGVTLHRYILRTDTATIAGLSILNYLMNC
jgi:16S rRNA (uracil1498-N3)-methyltransferase